MEHPNTPKEVQECATACDVDPALVQKMILATRDQAYCMDYHIRSRAYTTQVVMQFTGEPDLEYLYTVWEAIHARHDILRTRLVKLGTNVWQVVIKKSPVWRETIGLQKYLEDQKDCFGYGDPLFRFAFVHQDHPQIWSVLTAHGSAVDEWSLRLLWRDLRAACWDVNEYKSRPPAPGFSDYVPFEWQDSENAAAAKHWKEVLKGFSNIANVYPLQTDEKRKVCIARWELPKLLHLPPTSSFHARVILAHIAWALTLFILSGFEDILFLTMSPCRSIPVLNVGNIMGPIAHTTPIRVSIKPNTDLSALGRSISEQFALMIAFEHQADLSLLEQQYVSNPFLLDLRSHGPLIIDSTYHTLTTIPREKDHGLTNTQIRQSLFAYHPAEHELFRAGVDREIPIHTPDKLSGQLDPRSDLSTPLTYDHGLTVEVQDCVAYVKIGASWDHGLIELEKVDRMGEMFRSYFGKIVGMGGEGRVEGVVGKGLGDLRSSGQHMLGL